MNTLGHLLAAAHERFDPYAERILDAARGQLSEFGLRRTSLDDIAKAAQVGRATLFRRFPGREALFLVVLGTMMIPDQLRLVPVFQILTFLHLVAPGPENYFGVFIITAVSASSLFIMRQFFLTVPYDLEEAAMLDGAGTFGTFWRVMLPISTPVLRSGGSVGRRMWPRWSSSSCPTTPSI